MGDDISRIQEMAERDALMAAQYYQTLIRAGLPVYTAVQLTLGYQLAHFQYLAAVMQKPA